MKELWEQVGQTVRAALATWHGTARLCALLLSIAVAGAVFLAVLNKIKR
jgi:hypothetical protein